MPWTVEDVDKHNKGLSDEKKRQWVHVANSALQRCQAKGGKDCEASAIRQANSVVGKSDLTEFSLIVRKAYQDSSGEMRWKADASDIEPDHYGDSMSLELYQDFLQRIESEERPLERYCGDFWAGGMPYLSVSHYLDQNGNAVPGPVDSVYVDGKFLKAKGRFSNTPLGTACFNAVITDFQEKAKTDNRVRISIAFLDYEHKHKSNDYLFTRSEKTPFCPECMRELLEGEYAGKTYLKGHLIHLALTRVPVNPRTLMEVDKSMTTRKEDAASIVGEELAEQLDEKEKTLVGKSELVIKAETEKCPKCGKDMVDGKCPECDKEDKKEEEKSEAIPEVVSVEKSASPKESKKKRDDLILDAIDEIKAEIKALVVTSPASSVADVIVHPLDDALSQFKRDFDSVMLSEVPIDEKLRMIQEPFNVFGNHLVEVVRAQTKEAAPVEQGNADVSRLADMITDLSRKVELLSTQVSAKPSAPTAVPERRSINPALVANAALTEKAKSMTPNLHRIINRSVGLSE